MAVLNLLRNVYVLYIRLRYLLEDMLESDLQLVELAYNSNCLVAHLNDKANNLSTLNQLE